MNYKQRKKILNKLHRITWNIFLLVLGSIIASIAFNGIIAQQKFFTGGTSGLALIIHYLSPAIPISAAYLFFNLPLFLIGWREVGKRFFTYSVIGTIIFTITIQFIQIKLPIYDPMLAAIAGGVLYGIGGGIILKSLGSAGGLDILSVSMFRNMSIKPGTSILAFNVIVFSIGGFLFPMEQLIYSLLSVVMYSQTIDLILTGLNRRKAVTIMSSEWKKISYKINKNLKVGTTLFHGKGGYTEKNQKMIYAIVGYRELSRVKKIAKKIDPYAVIIVTETLEVVGPPDISSNQPHW